MNATRLKTFCTALFLCLASLALSLTLPAQTAHATYTSHTLALEMPYHTDRAGAGRLTVDVLNPEDEVLAHSEHTVEAVKGVNLWRQELSIDPKVPYDELVWQRVRYRFRYSGDQQLAVEQVLAIQSILRRPMMRLLGQRSYLVGAPAAIRVIVCDEHDGETEPLGGTVRMELTKSKDKPRQIFAGRLDARGTTDASFRFPSDLIGSYELHVVAETPIGPIETTQPIELEDKIGILLTTEKPVYQPSQTIHARILALDRSSHHAVSDRKLTFELEDSRGNKVFRKSTETDAFGIASAEFTLADEVNLGAYHLRALLGDAESPAETQETTLQVQRYVLPKFRVAIDFAKANGKTKRDYRPGDHVSGTVHANYFFGKPVADAPLTIIVQGMDVSLFVAAHAKGRTNASGDYPFDVVLPEYMTGRKQNQGAAPVMVEAAVTDTAGHAETKDESITVSQSSLLLTAVPEGGSLVPGMENQVFVLTSFPDGAPAQADIAVRVDSSAQPQFVRTDRGGVAIIHLTPARRGETTLHIDADDHYGDQTTSTVKLQSRDGEEQILLRTERAVYKSGERLRLSVLTTLAHGTAYIDIVKDGQTILTRDIDVQNGRAELSIAVTPQMAGTLSVHAYLFGRDAQTLEDQRMIFVQPSDELHIQATADAASYLPGSEANVRFHITNARGEGVQAALGLEIVDEAVFALAEKQPGFAKVFFYLEQELLKPRFEIHSLSMNDAVTSTSIEKEDQHDRAARALFSAAETVDAHTMHAQIGHDLPTERRAEFQQRYQQTYTTHVQSLLANLRPDDEDGRQFTQRFALLTDEGGTKPHDAWGTPLRAEPWREPGRRPISVMIYRILSAGPDGVFGTQDDLSVLVEPRFGDLFPAASTGTMELRLEHDRGPQTGRTEVVGMTKDVTGAVIPDAKAILRSLQGGVVRNTVADQMGAFSFSALPPGRYRLEITSPGFQTAIREFTMQPRDRAMLTCILQLGSVTETVDVTAAAPMLMTSQASVASLPLNGRNAASLSSLAGAAVRDRSDDGSAHVRSYFPEALYINSAILTDGGGNASIGIPIADSITTWHMAMFASTKAGALGSGTSSLKVFQDFFVDMDLPVTLTQGDRVSIPVAAYNYTDANSEVALSLQQEDWFELVDDTSEKTIRVEAGKVGGLQFTLQVKRLGKFKLTLAAHLQGSANKRDTVVRDIEVVPNGQQQETVYNGRLETAVQHTVSFPPNTLPDTSKIYVRLYPGPLSQVIEGMDGILRMPGGCFEQTSSSTYPNVLALDYMKRTKKLTPEVHARAEGYIANGYQRLLTFEVPGGGFSWFGQAPANKILTAYGLMEFSDMARVYDVDPRLIERTADWLAEQQQPDGSWKPDTQFINEGATDRYNSNVIRITAYLGWALEKSGGNRDAVDRARRYIASQINSASTKQLDSYTLAVLANFAVDNEKDSELTRSILQMLVKTHIEKGDQAWWTAAETNVYSGGESAAIEATGLAVQAFLKSGDYPEINRRALAWILSKKSADGNWGTTQGTIMALRALLLASEASSADAHGTVEVLLNGNTVQKLALTTENNDLLHQFVLPLVNQDTGNTVELRFTGSGSLAYQVAGRYFTSWPQQTQSEPLSIDVAYDRTTIAQNDIVKATATVRSHLDKTANMVMVDLGIPPGFDLQSEDLQAILEKTAHAKTGRLEKFSLTATQAILYLNSIGAGETLTFNVRLRAKYPVRAKNFETRVYEYYDPSVSGIARSVHFEVTGPKAGGLNK